MRKHVSRFAATRRGGHAGRRVDAGDRRRQESASSRAQYTAGRYLVTFADAPVAEYSGYVKGFPATRPGRGRKLDANSAASKKWQTHLSGTHDAAMAKVGATKTYDYTVTNNGVAMQLSATQAPSCRRCPTSRPSRRTGPARRHHRTPRTSSASTPVRRPLVAARWRPASRCRRRRRRDRHRYLAGEPAFAGGTGIPIPATCHGDCVAGQNFATSTCNDKLVGARYYSRLRQARTSRRAITSPRVTVRATGRTPRRRPRATTGQHEHRRPNLGTGSGMAPAAKIAMYKVCWTGQRRSRTVASTPTAWRRSTTPSLTASTSSTTPSAAPARPGPDSVEMAFRGPSGRGVRVDSAGNSGPGASTLDHASPWLPRSRRRRIGGVPGGRARRRPRYIGASTTLSLTTARTIVASPVSSWPPRPPRCGRCFDGTLDPAKTAGKIVECDRGVNARLDKSFEVSGSAVSASS